MNVDFDVQNDALRVRLCGEIDHHAAKELGQTIDFKIMRISPKLTVLDFDGVSFMDSSGLAVILGRKKLCDSIGSAFRLDNLSGYPKKIITMSGMDKLVNINGGK
jgi:anti-anti-sigma factor